MLSQKEINDAKNRALTMLKASNIAVTEKEKEDFEVSDFGLSMLEQIGLEVVTYVNNDIYCAKELILFPYQICPEHIHPTQNGILGKRETFRCRSGEVYLYVTGEPSKDLKCKVPAGKEDVFTVKKQIVLYPGEQYTLEPDTLHWFQAGPEGAIVSEFSSTSTDGADIFTDKEIKRFTEVID